MRHPILSIAAVGMAAIVLAGRARDDGRAGAVLLASEASATEVGATGGAGAAVAAPRKGRVVETMNSGGYTYVLVDDGAAKIWAAAPELKVAVGEQVVLSSGVPMADFHSKTLNRTFDVVYFVDRIEVTRGDSAGKPTGNAPSAPTGHGSPASSVGAVDLSNVAKAEGGYRVAELYADKSSLAGKEVLVRGKVVKVTTGVMGKTWIHIRDGSGDADTNDLTVTTSTVANIGDTVLARGKLGVDRDFGFGYKYAIIVEDAVVTNK